VIPLARGMTRKCATVSNKTYVIRHESLSI